MREAGSRGVELLAHGWRHLPAFTGLSEADLRHKFAEPRRVFQQNLGIVPRGFVFPHGRSSSGADRLLGAAGYDFALTSAACRVTNATQLASIPRFDAEHRLDILRRHLLRPAPPGGMRLAQSGPPRAAECLTASSGTQPPPATVSAPVVSVVMSVYNDAQYLPRALDSILTQTGVDFELIVVNDGSTDNSSRVLSDYARRDPRVRVVDQENSGLTAALIHGCRLAGGRYIARHDSDDISLPGRLSRQLAYLESHPEVALVACGTHFIGPKEELLYTLTTHDSPPVATARLRVTDAAQLRGPFGHGSVMFRRDRYDAVGGYRRAFRQAQDVDLWTRLTDQERLAFLPEVLYCARFTSDSISMTHAATQRQLTGIIVACREARARGGDEGPFLEQAAALCRAARTASERSCADGDYFIGRMLLEQGNPAAIDYLRRAAGARPWNLKVRLCLARAKLTMHSRSAPPGVIQIGSLPESALAGSPASPNGQSGPRPTALSSADPR